MDQGKLQSYWSFLLQRFEYHYPSYYLDDRPWFPPPTLDDIIFRDISAESVHKLPFLLGAGVDVEELTLRMTDNVQLRPLIDAPTAQKIRIQCATMKVYGAGGQDGAVDLGILQPILMAKCRELEIESISAVLVHPTIHLPNLRELTLTDVKYVPIADILGAFPKLQTLRLHHSNVAITHSTIHIQPRLTNLTIFEKSPSWIQSIHLPDLHSICLATTERTPDVLEFLRRHQTIQKISWANSDIGPSSDLVQLIDCAWSVRILRIDDYIPHIGDWTSYGLSSPPFPQLKTLRVTGDLSRKMFEQLVRRRCLPKSHPESELPDGLQPLNALCLLRGDKWTKSRLAKGSLTRKRYYDPQFLEDWVKLSWL